jgi:hypothetical protein
MSDVVICGFQSFSLVSLRFRWFWFLFIGLWALSPKTGTVVRPFSLRPSWSGAQPVAGMVVVPLLLRPCSRLFIFNYLSLLPRNILLFLVKAGFRRQLQKSGR